MQPCFQLNYQSVNVVLDVVPLLEDLVDYLGIHDDRVRIVLHQNVGQVQTHFDILKVLNVVDGASNKGVVEGFAGVVDVVLRHLAVVLQVAQDHLKFLNLNLGCFQNFNYVLFKKEVNVEEGGVYDVLDGVVGEAGLDSPEQPPRLLHQHPHLLHVTLNYVVHSYYLLVFLLVLLLLYPLLPVFVEVKLQKLIQVPLVGLLLHALGQLHYPKHIYNQHYILIL